MKGPVITYLQRGGGRRQIILNDRKKLNDPPFHFCVTYVTPPPNSVRNMLTPPPQLFLHYAFIYHNCMTIHGTQVNQITINKYYFKLN